ncbi:50S ribosomal protein L31 [Helicobacter pylori]
MQVTCVTSGKEIEVLSTKPEMRIDISSCPLYQSDAGGEKESENTRRRRIQKKKNKDTKQSAS